MNIMFQGISVSLLTKQQKQTRRWVESRKRRFGNGPQRATPDRSTRQWLVEPGRRGRREVKRPAGMPGQPFLYLGMFVGRVVVDDGVDRHSHRHLRLGGVEEADELLVPVALHVAADDGAVKHIERGEQRRCAMAFVVVGHRPSATILHRQTGLGAVERLDLALLIY